jgi:hypothetical protein
MKQYAEYKVRIRVRERTRIKRRIRRISLTEEDMESNAK